MSLRSDRASAAPAFLVVLIAAALLGTAGGSVRSVAAPSAACAPTRSDMLGPFYKPNAPMRAKVGEGHILTGVVRASGTCAPLAGARLEFWLAGPNAAYDDDHRAILLSNASGAYRFESNFPPGYSGRPPHIHIRVSAQRYQTLITQFYPLRGQTSGTFDLVLVPVPGSSLPSTIARASTGAPSMAAVVPAATTSTSGLRVAAAAPPQRFGIVPSESQVVYRVGETFLNENNRFSVAVGITSVVRGEIVIDRAAPKNSRVEKITVDISTFKSDRARRDQAIRERWLESARFPLAEFTPTAIAGLPDTYVDGRDVTLQITGNLKIRDVVKPAVFTTALRLAGTTLSGTATTLILMTDYGFSPPSILGILRAENEARLEFRFSARPTPAP